MPKKNCPKCGGTGRVRIYHEPCSYEYHYEDCPICGRKGKVGEKP